MTIETPHFFISGMSLCAMLHFSWTPVRILTVKGTSRTFRQKKSCFYSAFHLFSVIPVCHETILKTANSITLGETPNNKYNALHYVKKIHTYIVHSFDYLFKLSGARHQAAASALMRESKQTPSVSACHIHV